MTRVFLGLGANIGDREANMRLARIPRAPREQAWVTVSVGRVPDAWKPYIAAAS